MYNKNWFKSTDKYVDKEKYPKKFVNFILKMPSFLY